MSQPGRQPDSRPDGGENPRQAPARKPRQPWLWNVVLLDDQEHTDVYVIRMMQELFAMNPERATQVAELVDGHGRATIMTTHKELAELKRDQVLAFGKDPQVSSCKGSMRAVIEPAEEEPGT
jgi:ATP-dependent Clp protease adaptor protein ClpS